MKKNKTGQRLELKKMGVEDSISVRKVEEGLFDEVSLSKI